MGLIQELAGMVGQLNFVAIVHEYEQGLYFRGGVVIERRVRGIKAGDLAELVAEEREVQTKVGRLRGAFRRRAPGLPEGYQVTWSGRVRHPHRFSKVLRPGVYFHLPFVEHIVTDSRQERVLNLGFISVLTTDPGPDCRAVVISCNLRYEVMNLYRAYTAVYDYEASLRYHTLSILAQKSLGKRYGDWQEPPTIAALERGVIDELRKIVTDKWGLKIHQVYITDVTDARIFKFVGDQPMAPSMGANLAVSSTPLVP
ncbi:MAG: hypothetical protein COW73_06810 [Nitrospirae bacterium CG18_big_fil_WC_8_21_14_2_50_70_55]|nr:hypothetical protein [Deltaproteobacteria bacterium]OIP67090.1 MAG: hypothetical protein AUK30_01175 [Nitrospirae bacterium CG2_30_70_394]PIQ04925.1 MAG: hypothetical protein COW73_06810 [Nitrospirae bacterium CG18_big_fil_WC_8_21_14_2_50_70_55]PIU79463.1 MAG: hypothetical protein COS73_04110 [Nitrospirae bacterium CG06_land_8_20_14_3_00_70_43]PIW83996.1 MAG: hypothetical protein COZ96_00420 [Nitrospirae bacterium CG_4_8_14_3_um_filter_70_85]PIX82326.1 MAG: hypothetical protein COZ33_11250 